MNIILPLIIILALILVILLFKIIKNVIKTLLYFLLAFIIISGVFGYFVYKDVRELSNGILEGENIFILKDDTEFITGFILNKGNETSQIDNLEELEDYYQNNELDKILEDKYKLFIFETDAFEGELNQIIVDGIEILGLIDIPVQIDPSSHAFLILIMQYKEDPKQIISDYKEGKIIIYPETLIIKTIKYLKWKNSFILYYYFF